MSISSLSDAELATFAKDPQKFLSNKENQIRVLGLDDSAVRERLKKQGHDLKLTSGLITAVVTQLPTII